MTGEEIEGKLRAQLALELGCRPEDFSGEGTVITRPVLPAQRRRFSDRPFFLQMATFGTGTVISAEERLHPWLREWAKGKKGPWLFEQHNFYLLERELRKYGFRMAQTHHMFAPKPERLGIKTEFRVRWLEQEDIAPFYGREEFPNAICARFHPERPDVLAVVALEGEEIMGMAGCSADTPEMWQIGIDVLPPYRGPTTAPAFPTSPPGGSPWLPASCRPGWRRRRGKPKTAALRNEAQNEMGASLWTPFGRSISRAA